MLAILLHQVINSNKSVTFKQLSGKQTNRQTNQPYQKHNLLCQGGNQSSLGLLCSNMYESNTLLCTYWIPEIVEPTS